MSLEQHWISDFKRYLQVERQYSGETLKAYGEDLELFKRFLLENGGAQSFADVSNFDVHVYMGYLYDQQYKTTTISRMVSSLRSFYRFLMKNEYVNDNPFALSLIHI